MGLKFHINQWLQLAYVSPPSANHCQQYILIYMNVFWGFLFKFLTLQNICNIMLYFFSNHYKTQM